MKRLMVYDYDLNRNLLNVNLGDYVQSIAANQFLHVSDVGSYFSRDNMSSLRGGDCAILNGWYRIKEKAHLLAEGVNILPVSIHIHNKKELNDVVSVMRNWSNRGGGRRIGCRDLSTLKVLRDMGFDAYFSSCLTTTLFYEFGRIPFAEREGVVFCDVNFDKRFPLSILLKRRKMKKACEEILLSYKNEPVYKVTHMCPVSESHESRFALARSLLRLYSSAKVVITSRIHCALPCLAMGTPVILAVDNYDNKRYPGIDAFLNKVYYSSSGEFVADIQLQSGLVVNNEKHLSYANDLIRECESFVKSCSD